MVATYLLSMISIVFALVDYYYFLDILISYSLKQLAEIYIQEIVHLHDFRGYAPSMCYYFGGSWDQFLPLAEFAYNNSYQLSIQMAPYEALCGRWYRSPVGWFELGKARLLGTDLAQDALDKVKIIQDRLRIAQSKQKSYADCKVAYKLTLPPGLLAVHPVFHVSMLQKYHDDPSHVLDFRTVQLDRDLTYEEELVSILDRQVCQLRSKSYPSIRV
ncbi:uncharacterized protein [Nicotiana sylvestris]|uniref:uncharacterized protein n=1 Tax=Nicotiana sylvestris TaxID=4096 RepID=UPI00388CE684